jgi:hypothetical protein
LTKIKTIEPKNTEIYDDLYIKWKNSLLQKL